MGLLDNMQPAPRNRMMGLLADALTSANQFATQMDPRYANKRQNQTLGLLADAVSLGSLAKTADRASYGESLTNAGRANVPFLKPETADAMMMAPLSPRTALGAVGLAAGMGDTGAMRSATVWHGSPHKFDKFDSSKIGTGEGAQAYGHGLYLADRKDVASGYSNVGADEYRSLIKHKSAELAREKPNLDFIKRVEAKMAEFEKRGHNIDTDGNLYKVDLPDEHIAKMLDWDKPLSQQAPEVQAIFPSTQESARGLGAKARELRRLANAASSLEEAKKLSAAAGRIDAQRIGLGQSETMTGRDIYGLASDKLGVTNGDLSSIGMPGFANYNNPQTAQFLRELGIPGIRYLDGGSRTGGAGSSNFVVFPGNEGLLQILERNGAPIQSAKPQGLLNQNTMPEPLAYGTEHRPMTTKGGAALLHDLEPAFGADIYGKNALQFFGGGDAREKNALKVMAAVKGKPEALVTIYRGVPKGVSKINNGDWVTLDKSAAADYGSVISQQVPASHITSWPDSLLEFGYFPPK